MNELQPVNQNVLLEISEEYQEQKTASGIIIPDTAKEKQNITKLVFMSNIENAEITVGDKVVYKSFSGNETEFERQEVPVNSIF